MEGQVVLETLDALHEGVQILSPEWRYLYVNEAAARQGRKTRAELLGKSMIECYPGIDATPLFVTLARCMRERRAEALETDFDYPDGARASFELRVQPCRAGIAVVSLDITERRRLEERIRGAHEDALRELSTPVIRIEDRVLLVPIVGAVDPRRAAQLTERVLLRVAEDNASVVILDVAGVPVMDTEFANHLLQATAAVRLLGAETILTGVSPSAARTIVHLGLDLSSMKTTTQLSQGIALARSLGLRR